MAKMSFPNTVKYCGIVYKARQPFEVAEHDVEELQRKGGWLLEEPVQVKQIVQEPEVQPQEQEVLESEVKEEVVEEPVQVSSSKGRKKKVAN